MEEVKNVVANENFDWNAFENDLGVYDQDKAQITEAYDKTLSNVNAACCGSPGTVQISYR